MIGMPKKLNLRIVLTALLLFLCSCQPQTDSWQAYQQHFISTDGRVFDSGNQGISHSEGQGYAMLLAFDAGDQKTFAKLWDWAKRNLQVRRDFLLAWRYEQGRGVTDQNNASDGDILVAWALLKAGQNWQRPEYSKQGRNILADVRNKLIRHWQGKPVLLPGDHGFEDKKKLTINLSYWVFPALADFRRFDPDPVWQQLIEHGQQLQQQARFGRWNLPPNWLDLQDEMSISDKYPPRFGYDAIRIPLYLLWQGVMSEKNAKRFLAFADDSLAQKGYLSPTANLKTDQLAEYPAPDGIAAIYCLLQAATNKRILECPAEKRDENYYSTTLGLLSKQVARERLQQP